MAEFQPIVENLQKSGGAPLIDTLMYVMFGDTSMNAPELASQLNYWRAYMSQLGPGIGNSAYQVMHRKGILDEQFAVVPQGFAIFLLVSLNGRNEP